MTESQREAVDQAEQIEKALGPIIEQLTDIGDEVVMQLGGEDGGAFYKISKVDGADYGSD